jgi:hypothetical protein
MDTVHVLSYIAVAMAVMAVPLAVLDRVLASRARRPREHTVKLVRLEEGQSRARATPIQAAERRESEALATARSQSMSRSSSSNVG